MRAVAIKKGQSREKAEGFQKMGTFQCDGCGEKFFIGHRRKFVNKRLADKHAHWLAKVVAEEHERDKRHSNRIDFPDYCLGKTTLVHEEKRVAEMCVLRVRAKLNGATELCFCRLRRRRPLAGTTQHRSRFFYRSRPEMKEIQQLLLEGAKRFPD